MAQGPKRLCGASVLALGLVIGLFVAACGGSAATPSPAASAAAGGTALDGVWLLTDYVSVDGTNFTVPSAVTPNIRFDGNAASGQAGCNTFNAVAIIEGDQLRFDTVQSTEDRLRGPDGDGRGRRSCRPSTSRRPTRSPGNTAGDHQPARASRR